ncbi:MAG: DUF262 domain-containing HNH endonuclease family protein [Candidatus Omnitrophota bacterium]
MASINFNTANETFRKLLGNGLAYSVPMFQRDYSWEEDHWDDLWQDILETCKDQKEQAHYMGYLVIQTKDNKNFDIIDGQQRITTLSLLVLAVLKNLEILQSKGIDRDNNKKRAEQLRNTYMGYLDPVTLISRSKLQLNKHNDRFYQNYLIPLQAIPQRGLNYSEKLLKKALEWLIERVSRDVSNNDGMRLAQFIDSVADKLFFTVITVTDELNAFKVFETLNARGVRLSATDLLKNYLFSVVYSENPHETEMKKIEEIWEKIVGTLGSENFPDFLRVYWNSQNKLVRKTDLFKTIKNSVQNKEMAFSLIRGLDENADIYAALRDSDDELWTAEQKKYIGELKMFGIKQPYSLLMIARKKLAVDEFTRVLRACSIISFRYNVICNFHTGDQEKVYSDIAYGIFKGELASAYAIIDELKAVYPEDSVFNATFTEKELSTVGARNKKVVRYILFAIEKHLSNNDYDFDSDKYSIEHILPESPSLEWSGYDENRDDRFIYRIGNYTLLCVAENRDVGNKSYADKKMVYEKSGFTLTKKVAEDNNNWDAERIASRQKTMAKWATSVWRLV